MISIETSGDQTYLLGPIVHGWTENKGLWFSNIEKAANHAKLITSLIVYFIHQCKIYENVSAAKQSPQFLRKDERKVFFVVFKW